MKKSALLLSFLLCGCATTTFTSLRNQNSPAQPCRKMLVWADVKK